MENQTNLWEKLSEEKKNLFNQRDDEFRERFGYGKEMRYWFMKLSKLNTLLDVDILQWKHISSDLGCDSIDDAYLVMFNDVYRDELEEPTQVFQGETQS